MKAEEKIAPIKLNKIKTKEKDLPHFRESKYSVFDQFLLPFQPLQRGNSIDLDELNTKQHYKPVTPFPHSEYIAPTNRAGSSKDG